MQRLADRLILFSPMVMVLCSWDGAAGYFDACENIMWNVLFISKLKYQLLELMGHKGQVFLKVSLCGHTVHVKYMI